MKRLIKALVFIPMIAAIALWAYFKYIMFDGELPPANAQVVLVERTCTLHARPNKRSAHVGQVTPKDRIFVVRKTKRWYKTHKNAWVSKSCLTKPS